MISFEGSIENVGCFTWQTGLLIDDALQFYKVKRHEEGSLEVRVEHHAMGIRSNFCPLFVNQRPQAVLRAPRTLPPAPALARRLSSCARKAAASRATAGARPAPRVVSHQRLVALSGTAVPAFGFPTRPVSLPPSLARGGSAAAGVSRPRGAHAVVRSRCGHAHRGGTLFFFFAGSPRAVDEAVRRRRGGPALVGCLFYRRRATHRPGECQ